MTHKRGAPSWAVRSAGLFLTFALATGHAQNPPSRNFQIDPQPVARALRTFAAQAGIQLIYSERDVGNLGSAGVSGSLSPRDALERLLHGTTLEFDFTAPDVVVVRRTRTQTASAATDSPAGLPAKDPRPAPTQSTEARARDRSAEPRAEAGSALAPVSEVTVTGSRILRRDFEAASPILTIEEQAFEETGTLGVESVLNQLPQFVPADTQFVTDDILPTATNTPGIGSLNLRGLGTNRTLVLIDGRRGQPANSTLVIDTNSIPATAISSVEIISGGASATYGADAMGGVTNFKLRTNFQGASIEMRSGITEAGDGEESRASALFGSHLGEDRGNVMLGVEWTRRSEANIDGRPFFETALTDPGVPATLARLDFSSYEPGAAAGGLPSQAAVNSLFPERPANSSVNRNTSFYVNRDGSLFKDVGALGYTGELGREFKLQPSGVLGQNNLDRRISSPFTRYAIFGRGRYQIRDGLNALAQVQVVSSEVQSIGQPSAATGGFGASIPRDAEHPVPQELAALLDSRGENVFSTTQFNPATGQPVIVAGVDANWRLGQTLDIIPTRQLNTATGLFQLLAGFDGTLGIGDWTWEAYVSHGETDTDSQYIGFASLQRYRAIVQAPFYGRGFTQAGPGDTRISCTSGLPIFEQFAVTQDCIDALSINVTDRTWLSQDIAEINMQGGLMDLPAGELRSAVGATYRKNEFDFQPDAMRETHSIVDLPIGAFSNASVRGGTDVKEIYGELLLPVFRHRPIAGSLDIELGARYSDFNTAGGVPTWKALFSWSPSDFMRFRGGYQLANRAPNINELFLGESSVPTILRGPDACRADTRDVNGNHPNNPNRAKVQALCSAIIGTGTSTFDQSPDTFLGDGRTDGAEIEVRRGNPDVETEEGRTFTLGVVLTSPFEHALARNITIAVDGYRARIDGAISQVGAQITYDLCFNRDGISNPAYSIDDPNGMCRQIVRDGTTGNRRFVSSTYANLGSIDTSGIDLQANWRVSLSDLGASGVPGALSLNTTLNKLLEFESQSFPTSETRENKGTLARGGQFSYRALTSLRYTLGGANVALHWRRLPSVRSGAYANDPQTSFLGTKSYSIFHLSSGWRMDRVSLTAGVENLFNREPNRVGAGPGSTGAGTTASGYYDVLGRRYYASVKLNF